MHTLTDHLVQLTHLRARHELELTLVRALIDLLPVDRVVLARVLQCDGAQVWLDVVRLDCRGGGRVVDRLRVDLQTLPALDLHPDRVRCLREQQAVELAWAGDNGPRITHLPLIPQDAADEPGVLELHSGLPLNPEQRAIVAALLAVFGNLYALLAYSDRDGLTGLFNRKALDDTFYCAVLEELEEGHYDPTAVLEAAVEAQRERRHRVPPNYWLGSLRLDQFGGIVQHYPQVVADEVLVLAARVLASGFRTYDRLYRLGADHFVVLMHCPQQHLVAAAFERVRAQLERSTMPQVGHVTLSAGYTRVSAYDAPDTCLQRSGQALLAARSQGGNRVLGALPDAQPEPDAQ